MYNVLEDEWAEAERTGKPKPPAHPSIFATLPSLVHQTAKELKSLLPSFTIWVTDTKSNDETQYLPLPADTKRDSLFFDATRLESARQIVVAAYPHANMKWGVTRCYLQYPLLQPELAASVRWQGPGPFDASKCDKASEDPPQVYLDNNPDALVGKGLWRTAIFDEAHEGERNRSAYFFTSLWLKPQFSFLMSGFPLIRGVKDLPTYMRLIETDEFVRLAEEGDPTRGFTPDTDPYQLEDSNPASVYQASSRCFKKWVVDNEELDPSAKGLLAQKALKRFFIRRDYRSSASIIDDTLRTAKVKRHAIGDALPPLQQFRMDCPLSPSALEIYDKGMYLWRHRQRVKQNSTTDDVSPNGRYLLVADTYVFLPIISFLHVDKGKDPTRRFKHLGGRDRESLFCPLSTLHKEMPEPG